MFCQAIDHRGPQTLVDPRMAEWGVLYRLVNRGNVESPANSSIVMRAYHETPEHLLLVCVYHPNDPMPAMRTYTVCTTQDYRAKEEPGFMLCPLPSDVIVELEN